MTEWPEDEVEDYLVIKSTLSKAQQSQLRDIAMTKNIQNAGSLLNGNR